MSLIGMDAVVLLATTHLLATVFNIILSLAFRSQVRIDGIGSWLIFLVLGAAGGVLAWPAAAFLGTGGQHPAVILFAFGTIISTPFLHWILPSIAPDFQMKSFGATFTLAVANGAAAAMTFFAGAVITPPV